MTTVFLVNPASAGGATGRKWPGLAQRAAELGLGGDVLVSEAPGQLAELAGQAIAGGATLLVAVGGDGTVHEVANGILDSRSEGVELAVLPIGTGRDFARSLGLPARFEDAVAVAASGLVRVVDAGRARFSREGNSHDAWFVNFAGAGISGAIAKHANASSKMLGGRVSFLLSTVRVFVRWKSAAVDAAVDGERRAGPMFEVVAMNGPYAAGGMRVAPEARPDDGRLDCVLFGDVTKLDFLTTFPKIYSGRHLAHPKIELLRGSTVTVDAEPRLPVVLDGEQPGTTPARFEIVPRALRVRGPG